MLKKSTFVRPKIVNSWVLAAIACLSAVVGLVVLVGWGTGSHLLTTLLPGTEVMRPNAALGFVASGLCLWLARDPKRIGWQPAASRLLALLVLLLGLLTMAEYLFGWTLGVDDPLSLAAGTSLASPGQVRMAANTAFAFLLLGLSMLLMDSRGRSAQWASHGFALSTGIVGLLAVVGYAYGVQPLTGLHPDAQMALHTAVLFGLLSIGVLIARPEQGIMARLTEDSVGGLLLRRLLPVVVGLPLVLGWITVLAERHLASNGITDVSLMAIASAVALFALVWSAATRLNSVDEQRLRAQAEQRESANERERLANDLHLLLESTDEGLYGVDVDGRCTFINASASRMIGYSREEAFGKNMHDLIHHSCSDGTPYLVDDCPIYEAFHERRGVRMDSEVFWRKDGTAFPVEYSSYPVIERGVVKGAVVAFLDITRRRENEDAIRRLNEDLSRRASELAAANKELEAFSYSVSHDLRAPLRSIDGFSLALMEDYADSLDDTARDYLSRVRAASQRMGTLIDDMLMLSRLTRGEMKREDVDLSELAEKVVGELQSTDPDRQAEFVIQPGLVADGDPRLLHAIVENLLGNAWKFTSKEPVAKIEFGATSSSGKIAYFVKDNGVGFDMAYAGKLFGAFQRLHGPAEFSGNGIGLATVQRIVHRHGGRVWAEGEVGKGAAFYFTL